MSEIEELPYSRLMHIVNHINVYNVDKYFDVPTLLSTQDKQHIIDQVQTCVFRSFNEKKWLDKKKCEEKNNDVCTSDSNTNSNL